MEAAEEAGVAFAGEVVLPETQDAPAGAAQGPVDEAVAGVVGGEFLFPEGRVAPGLGAVDGAAVPETAIDKDGEAQLGKDEIGSDMKGRAALLRRLEVWAARQHGPTTNFEMAPPAGDFLGAEEVGQHDFGVLVPP